MPQRIFVAGEQGQVARALAQCYSARGYAIACFGRKSLDICNRTDVLAAVTDFRPDLVVNAAAYTKVDQAEDEPDQAFAVNRDGAGHLATASRSAGVPIIHISTDYVFDGSNREAYREGDATNALGVYGLSKLAGERAVAREAANYVILRSSWVCSPYGSNFVRTMLRLAAEREEIGVVDDQFGAPTFAADLATAIAEIGDALLSRRGQPSLAGVYHAANAGETTWCGFAGAIMAGSTVRNGPSCRIRGIKASEYPTRARRPANSRLDCTKLAEVFGVRLPLWSSSLEACLDQIFTRES